MPVLDWVLEYSDFEGDQTNEPTKVVETPVISPTNTKKNQETIAQYLDNLASTQPKEIPKEMVEKMKKKGIEEQTRR